MRATDPDFFEDLNEQELRDFAGEPATDEAPAPEWPELPEAALHGLAGDIVRAIGPHTEADPAALLLQFLAMFGNAVGRNAYFAVEADRHFPNLFCCLIGNTSKGRKGTSCGHVVRLFESVDSAWKADCLVHGLSSGEGLIWHVRDPIEETRPVKSRGRFTGEYETTITDQGVEDKRLLVVESEFARVLKTMQRDSNTLSAILRQAWDSGDLRTMTKSNAARATGAHISVIAHVTKGELLRHLEETEQANGFANRFLFGLVRRSKLLPNGGRIQSVDFAPLISRLRSAVEAARTAGEITRDEQASAAWARVYPELSSDRPGLLGAVTARSEAQVVRLSALYALLDPYRVNVVNRVISVDHLKAALALWNYCDESAKFIFGDALGDPAADELLRALRSSPSGMTRNDIRDFFQRNKTSEQITRLLRMLSEQGLIRCERDTDTGGRPRETFLCVTCTR